MNERLNDILSRAYALAMQAMDNQIDQNLAEELAGECAELFAHLEGNSGAFGDEECIDPELVELAKELGRV